MAVTSFSDLVRVTGDRVNQGCSTEYIGEMDKNDGTKKDRLSWSWLNGRLCRKALISAIEIRSSGTFPTSQR
jgi:hypothetical protein